MSLTSCAALMIPLASRTFAVPISADYVDDARCDPVANRHLSHELGDFLAGFPLNEAFDVTVTQGPTICAPDDGVANDWLVQIINISGIAYRDLFFVADFGIKVGNADGVMFNAAIAADPPTDAFRIDGTVTVTGGNDNLIFESATIDEIFEPGETWQFLVTNFDATVPPIFSSIGLFGASSTLPGDSSNASILATPVPEPATMALLGMGGLAMLKRRRNQNRLA
jgi:hypothetical protein